MYVLTPVARDPGLRCVVVSTPAWKNWAARYLLHKQQYRWTLPGEHRLNPSPLPMYFRRFSRCYSQKRATSPGSKRHVFGGES